MKRKAIKSFYSEFVFNLKQSDPGRWYAMAKKIGAVDQMTGGDVNVQSLSGFNNNQSAQKIAEHFAHISNQYKPIDNTQLPCYLPAQMPPQISEYEVYLRLRRLKKTKSTLPIDLPDKLRAECALFLAEPLSILFNTCLTQSVYPLQWKQEWVTPVPKITHPKEISDLRKISSTSDYSKLFESFLKDWIMEDISSKMDSAQYGGLPGIGTEHMVVSLVDRILKLLDRNTDRSAVIMAGLDWSSAFDRQDPTIAIQKFIKLGVRPSLIPLLASYLTDRRMRIKFNGELSEFLALIGGGPQGTLLGQLEYLVQSNDNADCIDPDDRFKYIDDLSILQLICLAGLLTDYDFKQHVASDVGIDQQYLSPEKFTMQESLNSLSKWTQDNLMMLNEQKCKYMIFSRSKAKFATRLKINNINMERIQATKVLGVWVSENLSWAKNCQEICVKSYSRLSMLTKLKYAGTSIEDLIEIYILFIRSVTEYCSVAFHSSLTLEESNKLERVQKTCLKIILGEMYIDYDSALQMCGLETLHTRRETRCLNFSLKSIKHSRNQRLFPVNNRIHGQGLPSKEVFEVNWARTEKYKKSAIPFCQRLLNDHFRA